MSILDAIYKNSQSVVGSLDGMSASLQKMQKQDSQEYKREDTHRKYTKEQNKRRRQDSTRVTDTIRRTVAEQKSETKKAQSGLGKGLAAAGIAAIIAGAIAKYAKGIDIPGVGGGGGGAGGGGGGAGGGDNTGGTSQPGQDAGTTGSQPTKEEIEKAGKISDAARIGVGALGYLPGFRQASEGIEIAHDLARGDVIGASLSAGALLPGVGIGFKLVDDLYHWVYKNFTDKGQEQAEKEDEELLKNYNKFKDWWKETFGRAEAKQTGGFAGMVPDLGQPSTGDHFYTQVEPGSFVLNRNAVSAMGFQGGGTVPVALERGEMVFSPGTFDGHMMELINSSIPRFQVGGIVAADHPVTGSGFSVGKDYKGRPSVFTKEAAEALLRAMKDSGGLVKTSDITSSKRSKEHNARVGGVPNSNHLYGNAVDIHGTSKAWLKKHGPKYGWHNLNYSGHDGHFDFKGGGNTLVASGTKRTTAKDVQEKGESTAETSGQDSQQVETKNIEQAQTDDRFGGVLAQFGKFGGAVGNYLQQLDDALGLSKMGLSVMGILTGGNPFLGLANAAGKVASGVGNAAQAAAPVIGGAIKGAGDAVMGAVQGGANVISSSNRKGVEKQALDIIGKYESDPVGGYNAVNQIGIAGGRGVMGYSGDIRKMKQHKGRALTDMSLQEIMDLQRNNRMSNAQWIQSGRLHAVGRYQFIGPTFARAVQALGLNPSQKYSPAVQDEMALWLLRHGGGGIKQWVGPADKASAKERAIVRQARTMKQKGGMVGALSTKTQDNLINFFEQSDLQNRYIATSGEPNVVMMNSEEPEESIAAATIGNNLPSYSISPRDNCPLSMYYIYNPSFNPIGIGVS